MLRFKSEDLPAMDHDNHVVLIKVLLKKCPFYQYKKGIFLLMKFQI